MRQIGWILAGLVLAAPAGVAHADDLYQFQSPSGNISCVMAALSGTTPQVACEIVDRTWSPPVEPMGCEGDWGDRVTLVQGAKPAFTCHSDTTRGIGLPALAYDASRSLATLTCTSAETGITCTDTSSGHFFRLSRQGYELH